MSGPRVLQLRERLIAGGDAFAWPFAPIWPEHFDTSLVAAVKSFQSRHGLPPDGVVGRQTQAELDVPVEERVEQLRVNLERLRWVAQDLHGDYLLVDVAGFSAQLYEDDSLAWSSRVVVGRPYRETPSFRSVLSAVVLNPSWTVPPTILRHDVLPKVAGNPARLAAMHMRVVDAKGHEVDPGKVDWTRFRTGAPFPYQLVQPPGPRNPLGELKFLLPNPYAIYLHDTPDKNVFERPGRALSSGCIRIERPQELAVRLLDDDERWSPDALRGAIDAGGTLTVPLSREVPVMLLYFTARADQHGVVRFRPDLYGRDAEVLAALQAPFRFSPVDRPGQRAGSARVGRASLRRSISSNNPMPASMAATKTAALSSPMPSATSPGPGQKPATPQPTPNTMLPPTSRRSM